MNVTWAQFLAELRVELNDVPATGGAPRYSDDLLYLYARDGIRDYSQFFPKNVRQEQLVAVEGSVRQYVLPQDILGIEDVQCPLDTHLQLRQERPGSQVVIRYSLLWYWIAGDNLFLNYDPKEGDGVYLSYYALHPVPADKTDATFVLTVPNADLELIKLFVMAKVQIKVRNDQSRLDRFKITSGSRDDNPMIVETTDFMERYHEGITRRMRGGRIQLYHPRRFVRTTFMNRFPW
jgi:hypothetical protein